VRNNTVQIVFSLLVLIVCGALEEMLPKFAGIGFPLLLSAVQVFSMRRDWFMTVVFALAAGAVEDSISFLPMMTSSAYFLAVAALAHWSGLPRGTMLLTYPFYQPYLALWTTGMGGSIFIRTLAAIPVGLFTVWAMSAILIRLEGKVAFDEAG
jgi:hypothetical protein